MCEISLYTSLVRDQMRLHVIGMSISVMIDVRAEGAHVDSRLGISVKIWENVGEELPDSPVGSSFLPCAFPVNKTFRN